MSDQQSYEELMAAYEQAEADRKTAEQKLNVHLRSTGGDPRLASRGRKAARNKLRTERQRRLDNLFKEVALGLANFAYIEQYRARARPRRMLR